MSMIRIIKNGEIYSPEYLGKKDILIVDEKIAKIDSSLEVESSGYHIDVIDAEGKYVFPGFIDGHVHITGGGAEGGYASSTPEIFLSELTGNGITTVVGLLGTDSTSRSLNRLYAKAKALEEEGMSAYIYSGSFKIPCDTFTGSIREDIFLIDNVIGFGELAVADTLGSQPTHDELNRIIAESRLGGAMSGKSGIVLFHAIFHNDIIDYLMEIDKHADIVLTEFILTHMATTKELLEDSLKHTKNGGYIDLTTTTTDYYLEHGETRASESLKYLLENGSPIDNITFSSDAQGSLSLFDENRDFIGMDVGSADTLYGEVKTAIKEYGIPIEVAIKVITDNPARILGLKGKGQIKAGNDADFVFVDKEELKIQDVIARGKHHVQDGHILIKGVFEKKHSL